MEKWATLRAPWDEYVVRNLIEQGGPPPLHALGAVRQQPRFEEVECVFVDHRGQLVRGIWLPWSFVAACYRDHPAVAAR